MVFDLDDLCDDFDPWQQLMDLKRRYPEFRCTLFAIPGRCSEKLLEKYLALDWVELGVHGYHHSTRECAAWGYEEAKRKLEELSEVWPGPRLFKAPGWSHNEDVCRALMEGGWMVADHVHHRWRWGTADMPRYCYNAPDHEFEVYHGHTWETSGNGPSDWMAKDFSNVREWKWVSEVVRNVEDEWEFLEDDEVGAAYIMVESMMRIAGVPSASRASERRKVWSWYAHLAKHNETARAGDVLVVHHLVAGQTGSANWVKWAGSLGVKMVVPCEITARTLRREFGLESTKIGYWLPPAEVLPKADEFRVGIMGNATATYKNFQMVRDVCQEMGVPVVDWADGEIRWDRDREDFFRQCAVVVNMSIVEGGPLPPMEALQRGRLAISTPVGMMPEIAESEGLLLIEQSKAELKKAIERAREKWATTEPANWLPEWVTDEARVREQWEAVLC